MNRTTRNVIFWIFILLFLVGAPLSVLYTAGFRYNAKNGNIVRTGVISVTSTPRNASIFLDGVSLEKTTPFVIKYVLPGNYQMELGRDGYHAWSGEVEVRNGETTNIHDAFLFLDSEPEQRFIKMVSALAPTPNGNMAAYLIREGGWEEIWLFDTKNSTPWMIERVSIEENQEETELVWSADGSRLLARDHGAEAIRVYSSAGAAIELDTTLPLDSTNVFWHPSDGSILYLASEIEVIQFDFETGETVAFKEEGVVSVLIDASVLTFVDNGANVELWQTVNEERELIALLPRSQYNIEERDGPYILLRDKRDSLLLLDIRAQVPILLETTARVYDWFYETDKLVWSDGNEVSIYTPATHTSEFITRQSDFIESISWHSSGKNILIGTATHLSSVEADRILEQRVITPLMAVQNIETFWVTEDGKTAFFYGLVEGASGLYSLGLTR